MKLVDFANLKEIEHWSPINDAVMGGISESRLRFDPAGHVVFLGNVSFANNGGFSLAIRGISVETHQE